MWVKMDWAKPRIIKGGYLLRSSEVAPEGFWCHIGQSVLQPAKASTPFSNRMSLPNGDQRTKKGITVPLNPYMMYVIMG